MTQSTTNLAALRIALGGEINASRSGQLVFISFSGNVAEPDPALAIRQALLGKSAVDVGGADRAIAWTRDQLINTEYYRRNKALLDEPRGAGYWSWKPYIIKRTLSQLGPHDWVVYSDVGKPFRRSDPERAGNNKIGNIIQSSFDAGIQFAEQQGGFTPGIWIPHYGSTRMWAKRDCFVGMGCDSPEYYAVGHVQAGYSLWSNSAASHAFLDQWLLWCQIPQIINDAPNIYGKPNFPEFVEHRHDQAIMTNLVVKNSVTLFGPKTESLPGYRDFNMILRHMALQGSHKQAYNHFASLWTEHDELPSYLGEPMALWCLPDLQAGDKVWALQSCVADVWRAVMPSAQITIDFPYNSFDQIPHDTFAIIFAGKCESEREQLELLPKLYAALSPGGTLFLGPYKSSAQDQPALDQSFSRLINWITQQQRFPENMPLSLACHRNALTLGNAVNPVQAWHDGGNRSYAVFRKPKFNAINELQTLSHTPSINPS